MSSVHETGNNPRGMIIEEESKMGHKMIDRGIHFSSYVMQLCSLLVENRES